MDKLIGFALVVITSFSGDHVSMVIMNYDANQSLLVLNFTEELRTSHKKKVCLEQNISIGSFHASFDNFHNVSIYVK